MTIGAALSVAGWDLGDFNYDGIVNAADFTVLARRRRRRS
jgi:hypothetical protein